MLKRLSTSEKIALALDAYAAAIRDAFLRAIAEIKSTITLSLVVTRIEANDVEGAIRALNIEAPVFNPVLDEIAKAYSGGGSSTSMICRRLPIPKAFGLCCASMPATRLPRHGCAITARRWFVRLLPTR